MLLLNLCAVDAVHPIRQKCAKGMKIMKIV